MIYQKNPESDATQPTGEHISIVVFSPLKIINPNISWVCFCAVQVKPAFKTWLFFFSPFEICLEKTKLISMLYGGQGHTTFFSKMIFLRCLMPELTCGGLSKCTAFTSVSSSPALLKIFHFPSLLGTPLLTA